MNQKPYRSTSERLFRAGLLVTTLFSLVVAAHAVIDNSITQKIWKMKFGVSDAQLYIGGNPANGLNTTWLNADDDTDGIKNGDELAAGTSPFNGGSTIRITSITGGPTVVNVTFPTEDGKQYVVQGSPSLSGAFTSTGVTWIGTGVPKTLPVTAGGNQFFRVLVQDVDSDSDGAGDWAEKVAGYNPNNPMSNGTTNDATALTNAIATSNVITVAVTKASGTQPSDAASPVVDSGSITITRNGQLTFSALSVPLQKLGTATEGTDYDNLPGTAAFAPDATQVVLAVNPKYNVARKTNVTAIVKALGGIGYTLGASSTGSVVINPGGVANGTGLTGKYQNTSNATYSTQQTIFNGSAEMTRTDATVDFANAVNGWGTTAGPTGLSPASTDNSFSVRWTGQILPQFSETYYIDFRSDDSAKVWVNGVLLIDRWTTQGATDYINSINLTAGVLYDIQIDYWNNAGSTTAEARLYWWSASQPKQIIPTSRLFPAPTQAQKVTAVTNSLTAVGYVGVPLNFSVVTPNISGAVTYALDGNSAAFPPGSPAFALNPTTGLITGTPTVAGTYNVAINALNSAAGGAVTGSSVITFTIYPTGSVTREKNLAVNGTFTADGTIPALDDDANYSPGTARRLRGYIVPPKTGNYYFWLAASNTAELWISTDSEYVNRVRRATVTGSTGKKVWNASPTQQTQWLYFVAGQKYYFDVLHNVPGGADDYVALGWCQDDVGTVLSVSGDPNPTGATPLIPNGGAALQGYPLSGTVPSYAFQPYDYPSSSAVTGGLFSANLGPQGSSNTKASGSANLRTDADALGNVTGNSAILHFTYQGLSSPRTGYHLHSDAFGTHPAGEIIFDIDDVDMFHPELKTADGGYIWNFEPVGTFTSIQQIRDAITQGKVYLNVHSVTYPGGEIRGNLGLVKGSQTPPDPTLPAYAEPPTTDVASNDAHVARFLNQAAFGPSPGDIAYIKANGFAAWITNQLAKAPSRVSGEVVANITADINTPYPSSLFTNAWWKYSITGPDQLRQRLAFALSEIMVVSWANNTGPLQNNGRILADYYDNLVDYCLPTAGVTDSGNFKGCLKSVTLTPAMGLYLDMRGNQKEDLSTGRHPNENYAREIMQLFSVGINRTWDDGKFVLNSNAEIVPTYNQTTILGLSSLLTGWNYAQPNQGNGRLPTNFGPAADYLNPMVLVPSQHDFVNAKLLLNNVVTPAATGLTPRVSIASIATGTPCTITTATDHGLTTGDTVRIAGVTGGTFAGGLTAINATFAVTVTGATGRTFTVPVNCSASTGAAGTVTGAKVTPATYTSSLAPVSGSQADSAGTTLPHPYDQYGLKELDVAIDNIVSNDNVAPYICRQLIQRFVTSNPSPGYLYRVVQKFKNNGSGVRGDMAAVISQILLDGEARSFSTTSTNNAFGKQREPMLRLTCPARAFQAVPYSGTYTQLTGVNSNKIRLVTALPNDFNSGFTVSLDFRGNYSPAGQTLSPGNVPTSTTYGVNATLGIAATYTDIATIGTGTPTVVTTVQPHGLPALGTAAVTVSGVSGVFTGTSINSTQTAAVLSSTSLQFPINTVTSFQVSNIAVGTPCTVTTVAAHGLSTGNLVTLNGINGGAFSPSINATFPATVTGANTFTVPSNCTSPPTSYNSPRLVSNPCRVTTVVPHGLTTGDSVTISGVSGGTFTPTINATYPVTAVDSTSFTLPIACTAPSTSNTGSIVGGNTLDVPLTGMVNVTYSQLAGSSLMTVNTGGPQTNIAIPSPTGTATTLKSKVYLSVLSRTSTAGVAATGTGYPCPVTTTAPHGLTSGDVVTISGLTGGTFNPSINSTYAVNVVDGNNFTVLSNCTVPSTGTAGIVSGNFGGIPASGVYDVESTSGTTSFTVTTVDTPTAARTGNVIVPKITTSYTPETSNTIVKYNTNVNHNLSVNDHIWVDVPVVGSPVTDAEYVITQLIDEDHFRTSYLPVSSSLGTYPKPSGSNNGVTIFPLVAPLTGRSGIVTINQSGFNLGSTEATLTQSPLNAPTVFNYFFPDYKFPGVLSNNRVDSPEFQLSTDTNISNLTNSMTNMFIGTGGGNSNLNGLSSFNNGNGSVVMDIGAYVTQAKTSNAAIPALIDELASLLIGAPLEAATKTTIQNFVTNNTYFPLASPTPTNLQMRDRVRAIIHLIITSAEYAVQK